jgi:DNA-binding transcriptional ArsR family regulator
MNATLKTFAALSDPTRLRLVLLLLERDLCVCELESVLRMSQSRISHQLRILREAELVVDRRDGQWVIYGIPRETRARLGRALSALGPLEGPEIAADRTSLRACLRKGVRPCQRTGWAPGTKGAES